MKNKTFVVRCPEHGWDCIICVIKAPSKEKAIEIFEKNDYVYNEDIYIFHETVVYK